MPPNAKRIVITGASGFVGKACVEYLNLDGYEVLRAGRSHSDEIFCDLSDPKSCLALGQVSDIHAIIHLGAKVGLVSSSIEQMYAPNVLSTALIADIARTQNSFLIFASTVVVSGIHSETFYDQSPLSPDTPYAQSKALAEECIRASSASASILRIGGVYGLNGPKHLGLNRVIDEAMHGIAPTIYGDGSGKRNYIFVDDLAVVIGSALQGDKQGVHVVAGPETLTIHEMIQEVCNGFGIKSGPVFHSGDSSRSQIVNSSLGFTGVTPFAKSLEAIKRQASLS
jgi:UDP-glucose 4-epimerase